MGYYDQARKSAIDIREWVANEDREPWSKFCQVQMIRYGFAPKRTLTTLEALYPGLTIEKDQLVKANEVYA